MTETRPTVQELLAAYASGALRGAEAAAVEELLARDPAARAELEALRSTLAAVRAVEPVAAAEPDWDQMARDIRAACVPARPGLWARLRAALRPQHALLGAAVAGVAALLIVMLLRRHPAGEDAVVPEAPIASAPVTPPSPRDTGFTELDGMDEEQLAALEAALGAPAVGPDDGTAADDDEALAAADDDDTDLGMFDGSSYDDWLAAMSEDDLDDLEAGLDG
ncbi:MAG TPA: hypothetical protein VL172_08170 [Kofleriaceae bacterium]|nr:hypothetical protein [Kofleriaceae bacterium]